MKICLFGGTGFIGKKLEAALVAAGHEVLLQDVRRDSSFATKIAQSEGVINLGGHPLFTQRWTDRVKAKIHDSRVDSTNKIVKAIADARSNGGGPKVFVNASAIGYYGSDPRIQFDESRGAGNDFLAFVCRNWEEAAQRAEKIEGLRVAIVRIGVVLGEGGGALDKLLLPFKLMGGTLIGSGEQPFSWVHLDDVVGIFQHAVENDSVKGVLNATSPNVESNASFSHALGHAVGRPQPGLMGPSFIQKAAGMATKVGLYVGVGEAAEVIANGQYVVPKKTLESGYQFKFEKLDAALKDIVS